MSRISVGLKKTIAEIKRLADGSDDDQKKACKELLQKKIFPYAKFKTGIPKSVIPDLLPTIIKFLESNDHVLQEEGARFINCITDTPDEKTHAKLVIDAGVIPKFKNLLSSTNTDVLISTLAALVNITHDFPEKFVENEILQSMIHYLKSENPKICYEAAKCMTNISQTSEHVAAIFEVDGVKHLIRILDSKNDNVIEWALKALLNITSCNNQYCQRVLDYGGLKSLKKICNRLLVVKKPKSNCETDLKERKAILLAIKISAIQFFEIVTSYGEAQVNLVIQDNFIPIILQQIKCGMTPEMKIQAVKIVENITAAKPDFIPVLVQDYDIFSICYSNLGSTNADLIITCLTAMCNIIELFEDRDIIRQKFQECYGPTKLTNLCKHKNEEIRSLSTMLYEFVFDVKPDPFVGVSGENNQQEPEVIELDIEDDDIIGTPQTRQRKRQANSQPVLRRSKRFRVSLEQADTETSDSSSDDDSENEQYNDFDDHPRSSFSPGAVPTESNRHDHSGRSFVDEDTVAVDDGTSRLNPKRELSSPPRGIPTTPASRRSPNLPAPVASTNDETDQDEMKPSVADRLGNRSRLASNHSHVKPEPASTNDGNTRDNQVECPTAVNSETAATADESVREGKQSPIDADTSAVAPVLPVAAASTTIDETMQNDIPSRKPSPDIKPVITFVIRNQVTPPVAATENNDIIRDETIKYWRPAEFLIHQYCATLEIQFNRKDYDKFIPRIQFTQITSISKPDTIFQPIDQTGFGCLSILLSGNEDVASTIRMKINKKFINDLDETGNFDEERITNVIAPPYLLKEEHLQTTATWLKCRILVYCNGWKKYGSWETEDQMIPIFVLNKKENDYQIVLDIKNNNVF